MSRSDSSGAAQSTAVSSSVARDRGIEELRLPAWLERIGSARIHALAEEYGTPFYLYDVDAVNERIEAVRKTVGGHVKVFYAVKANPNLALLRAVREVADGLDISSAGELDQALLAGFPASRLSFAGPAKTDAELDIAIQKGVGCISIESVRELLACIAIAKHRRVRANVGLRINPAFLNRSFGLKMGGKSIQFGIDEEHVASVLQIVQENAGNLVFRGIHVYAGSQCFEADAIVEGVKNTFRIVRQIEQDTGVFCASINLGGGFGVSHGEKDRELDLAALAGALLPVVREFQDASRGEREIIFELGRFLTALAGAYITRVVSSKESRGTSFFMVDGGLNHQLAAAGTFGAALRANYPVRNLSRPDASRTLCSLAGPSCNPTDMLGINVELPRPEHGDLIAVLKSGSYGYTASPLMFLGRPTPAELVSHEGKIVVGRTARGITDFN
jgi:diaminopimelate decarboxylase